MPRPQRLDRRLIEQTIRSIVAAYEAGATSRQLAAEYDIARSSLITLLRRRGVSVRHRRLTAEEMTEMIRLYESGLSQVAIADMFGRHTSVVWHVLERAGLKHAH